MRKVRAAGEDGNGLWASGTVKIVDLFFFNSRFPAASQCHHHTAPPFFRCNGRPHSTRRPQRFVKGGRDHHPRLPGSLGRGERRTPTEPTTHLN
jgi:hypothetical protein